jgi:hypothetical protein
LEVQWKRAVQRFILNNLEQLSQADVDAWLDGEIEIAPLMEEPLKAISQHRDTILREMHQMSPPEIFDRLMEERPELVFPDKNRAIVRIGKELESLKLFLMNL